MAGVFTTVTAERTLKATQAEYEALEAALDHLGFFFYRKMSKAQRLSHNH